MTHKLIYSPPLWAILLTLLAGCASQGVMIGSVPSDPAPRIVFLGAKDAQDQDYLTWENISSFGKVPSHLQAVGDISCMRLGLSLRATGYHPRALDRRGQVMPGGGYYCEISLSANIDGRPPQLILNNGQLGWDRPGAFGAVPAALIEVANRACLKQGSNFKPLGYHPKALDQTGKSVAEGGFLCID
jgi:hypothetical protein